MLMIAAPLITFCYQISVKIQKYKKLHEEDGILDHQHVLGFPVLIMTIIIILSGFSFLFLTSSRDPGIVPRNAQPLESPDTSEVNTPSIEWISGITPHLRLPRTKDVIVNGFVVKVKYCDTCFRYRRPALLIVQYATTVFKSFDHHCPWIGQCIGLTNYRFFFFISTSTFLCIYVFTLSVMNIIQERKKISLLLYQAYCGRENFSGTDSVHLSISLVCWWSDCLPSISDLHKSEEALRPYMFVLLAFSSMPFLQINSFLHISDSSLDHKSCSSGVLIEVQFPI